MTQEAKIKLDDLNRRFFDDNMDEMIWSDEKKFLTIKMKNKTVFTFEGDTAKDIYKQLVKGSMK